MAELSTDQVRALDQTRQRLLALQTSLIALRSDITTQSSLPSWPALQTHANLISNNLQTIAAQLAEHREAFQSTVAFPLPQFPGKERAFILETLLRTKLEPNVEDWVEEGESIALRLRKGDPSGISEADLNALWQWAPTAANKEARKQKWGADFTLEEKQRGVSNVVTGLRRELVEPPDEEDEEGDEDEEYEVTDEEEEEDDGNKMEVEQTKSENKPGGTTESATVLRTATQMPLQSVHKFMVTGR
ncbi:Mediator of RNA polymerase II transcription subunit 8 [Exophiala dermatitidis]|uniref:Mediator of RNA polymerase II transcription subunit 8 n=1 Tax=Exophiala dermatitidis (strain ATCC 34100 / CBS 525.76 / NIH/UT8656) TaxID=858893 RepID=H6BJU3_EXODN|nr:uncharacterized protein HMPREF1120_00527 [Exophiala dermatitidis NIH/UT8656]EHY52313.1 hypothetical protein HMPREF1120_00527 [Exophiala dermatitidis NIH/UT8656]